jgi:hypothetical protein
MEETGHVKSYILMHKSVTLRAKGSTFYGAQLAQMEKRKRRCNALKAGLAVR